MLTLVLVLLAGVVSVAVARTPPILPSAIIDGVTARSLDASS